MLLLIVQSLTICSIAWFTTFSLCSSCSNIQMSKFWILQVVYNKTTCRHCCDRKSRAACAQSFAPWQQATIEIMLAISLRVRWSSCSIVHTLISAELPRRNLSYCCLLALHIWWGYSPRTSRPWWITHLTQRQRKGQTSSQMRCIALKRQFPREFSLKFPSQCGVDGVVGWTAAVGYFMQNAGT